MAITAAASAAAAAATPGPSGTTNVANQQIANNFQQFLQLLTTQLQNQNPLDPLDTNQFTQQLVQFAQVEQQINMNTSLTQLIALQQTAQMTQAIGLLGSTVTVDGSTAKLNGGSASWTFTPDKTGTATINIKDSSGQTVYSTSQTVSPGEQTFTWDGKNNSGAMQPDGKYTISVSLRGYERPDGRLVHRAQWRGRERRHDQEPAHAVGRRTDLHAGPDPPGAAVGS